MKVTVTHTEYVQFLIQHAVGPWHKQLFTLASYAKVFLIPTKILRPLRHESFPSGLRYQPSAGL